jgi:putative transposase
MSEAISESRGKRYGVQRVCRVWERARSSVYERRQRAATRRQGDAPARRGPKPKQADSEVLAAIQADLERSPFKGEGHRKVHARLRIMDDIRVSRKRVLRIMWENSLLSPHRVRQGKAKAHDGKIIRNIEEVREAVSQFVEDYNAHWRPEKLDFKTPVEARREHVLRQAA